MSEAKDDLSFEDRVARDAIKIALDALKALTPDNPECTEHLANAERELRAAYRALRS